MRRTIVYSTILQMIWSQKWIIFPLKKSNMQSESISSLQTLVVCSVVTTNLIEGMDRVQLRLACQFWERIFFFLTDIFTCSWDLYEICKVAIAKKLSGLKLTDIITEITATVQLTFTLIIDSSWLIGCASCCSYCIRFTLIYSYWGHDESLCLIIDYRENNLDITEKWSRIE